MTFLFDIHDWYWIVAGDQTQVYSSKAIAVVPTSDANYQHWLTLGNMPTKIASEQELWDALTEANVAIPQGKATSDESKTKRLNAADRVQFNMLFNHENRVRTLEGQPPRTQAQFVTFVKSQMV